jgi:molecular chaperone DnaJ
LVIFSVVPLRRWRIWGGGGGQRRTKGSNLRIKVKLTLEELLTELRKGKKNVRYKRQVFIERAVRNGQGQVMRVTTF